MPFDLSFKQHGIFVFSLIFLLLLSVGSLIQSINLTAGILITEIVLILLPVLLAAEFLNLDLKPYFRLNLRNLIVYTGSLIFGFGGTLLATAITALQSKVIPFPFESRIFLENMTQLKSEHHFIIFFLLVAVVPAVCEEFLFRGYLMEYLIRRWNTTAGITLCGVGFAVFHISYYRFLPVTVLGIIIGYTVWKTDSLLSGILIHILNNSFALTLLTEKSAGIPSPDLTSESILILLGLAGLSLGLGLGGMNLGEYISRSAKRK